MVSHMTLSGGLHIANLQYSILLIIQEKPMMADLTSREFGRDQLALYTV